MYRIVHFILLFLTCCMCLNLQAQNISASEKVQIVGSFNGFTSSPYNTDYRTTNYRRVSINSGTPVDGRGQWSTTVNAQPAGGDIIPISMNGGTNGFVFISGPSIDPFANRWGANNVGMAARDAVNNISCFNCPSGNNIGLSMQSPGFYTFNFNDCGYTTVNAQYYIGYTASKPVDVNYTVELLNPDGSATVNLTTSHAVSPKEKVYLRYTTGPDFSAGGNSVVLPANLVSGNNYSVTIPTFINDPVVRYYLFTSTRTLAELNADNETQKSLDALRYDDNNGINYAYRANTLPVIIRYFSGRMTDDHNIRLTWVVEQEVNMQHYEIYRSNNGVVFSLLGTVTAQGNSSSTQYAFTDQHPNTLGNYYKIICVDRGGKRSVSKIEKVNYTSINNTLTIYPNPVQKDLNVSIADMQKGEYRINIYADGGQMVYSQLYDHNGFDKTLHLVLPETIKTGPYRLYISNQYEFFKGTFIVQ